jgi:O-acetylhomoserine/O-acetylserine sulfhydrylase-like pyridoxal-dependent enzyme
MKISIESADDLIADLELALEAAPAPQTMHAL